MRNLYDIMKTAELIQDHSIMKSYIDYGIILYEFYEREKIRSTLDKAILFEWYSDAFIILDAKNNISPQEKALFELFQKLNITFKQFKEEYISQIDINLTRDFEIICGEWEKFKKEGTSYEEY